MGAVMASNSATAANEANQKNVKATNETNAGMAAAANATNLAMFHAARGSGGNAVMPEYLKGTGGGSFERELGQQMVGDWNKLSASNSVDKFKAVSDQSAAARAGADNAISGIFNGQNEAKQMANLKPVEAGRVAFSRQASMDALNKTLGEISATQAQQGFTGDSMGNRMMQFRANRDQGDAMAGINLQNLQDERAIHDQALQSQVSNAQLPYQMQANDVSAYRMPQDQYTEAQMKGLQPLTFLRIGGTQPFRSDVGPGAIAPPAVQPNASAMQLAMQGIGATGNMAAQYFLKQQQAKNVLNARNGVAGAGAGDVMAGTGIGYDASTGLMYDEAGGAAAAGGGVMAGMSLGEQDAMMAMGW